MKLSIIGRFENALASLCVTDPAANLRQLARQIERGDADSAGSTLRTVFVVGVVALVLTTLGPGIVTAAQEALASLGTRP
jgi:hypothetical protein